jgi:hypothetical protein
MCHPEANDRVRKVDERLEVLCLATVADFQRPKQVHPTMRPFNDPPPGWMTLHSLCLFRSQTPVGDVNDVVLLSQSLAAGWIVISLVLARMLL